MSIHDFLKSLRELKGLSHADAGAVAELDRTSVWKSESPKFMVKAGTLKKLLLGYGLAPEDEDFARAVALWAEARVGEKGNDLRQRVLMKVAALKPEQLKELQEWLHGRIRGSRSRSPARKA